MRKLSLGASLLVTWLAGSTLSTVGSAAEAPRIVISPSAHAELERKLRAEASDVGLSIESERTVARRDDADRLEQDDIGAIIFILSPDRVRIYAPPSGQHAAYDITLERSGLDRGNAFAVRVVEQIRARWVELGRLSEPEPAEHVAALAAKSSDPPRAPLAVATAPPIRDQSAAEGSAGSPLRHLRLSAGFAGALANGGIGVTPELSLGLRLEPTPVWSASVYTLLPLAPNELSEIEGSAEIRVYLFLGEAGYSLLPESQRIQIEVGPGAGVLFLPLQGEALAPSVDRGDRIVTGLYFLHASGALRVSSWLRLRTTLRAGTSAPRPVVRFDEREVATWGRAFLGLALTAELGFPVAAKGAL